MISGPHSSQPEDTGEESASDQGTSSVPSNSSQAGSSPGSGSASSLQNLPDELIRSAPLMDLQDYQIHRDIIEQTTGKEAPEFSSPELDEFVRDVFSRTAFQKRQDDTAVSLWNDMYARTLKVFQHIVNEHLNIPNNGYMLGKSTALAQQVFQQYFGVSDDMNDVCAIFVPTGTAANRMCTTPFLDSHTAVVATSKAHLVEREGRAVEAQTSSSVYVIECESKRLTAAMLDEFLQDRKQFDPITQKPKFFCLSNPEEDGIVYTVEELKAISEVVHAHNMLFHVDGARLFHAAAALDTDLRAIATEAGVDTLALGGSKIGLFMANAAVFLPSFFSHGYEARLHNFQEAPELFDHLRGSLKRLGLLAGQSEAMASQFLLGMHNNLLVELASIANSHAHYLGEALDALEGCYLYEPIESNVAMVSVPREAYERLLKHFEGVKVWHDPDPRLAGTADNVVARFITSATMDKKVINDIITYIGEVVDGTGQKQVTD